MGGGEEVSLRVRQLVSADSRCQWRNLETGVKLGQEQWQSVRRARDTSQETLRFPQMVNPRLLYLSCSAGILLLSSQ